MKLQQRKNREIDEVQILHLFWMQKKTENRDKNVVNEFEMPKKWKLLQCDNSVWPSRAIVCKSHTHITIGCGIQLVFTWIEDGMFQILALNIHVHFDLCAPKIS